MKPAETFDILIIGGGIIGLSLARRLRKRGIENIGVIEKNPACGSESSDAAAGMLAPQSEADCADDFFRFCSESRDLYSQFAAELFDETGVDIELDRSGTVYLAFNETDAEELEKRFAWQTKANLRIEKLGAKEILEIEPNISPDVIFGLHFPDDWQVENRKLVSALQKSVEANDVEIFTGTEIKNLLTENGKVVGAETQNEKYFAEKVVLATGAWTSFIKIGDDDLPLKIEPVRGQILCFQTSEKLFSKVIYTPRGYLVPRRDGRILSGATVEKAGFDKSVTNAAIEFLRGNAFEIAPCLESLTAAKSWAGLRPFAADGLPVLGEFPDAENLFIATAHYRNGILLAPKTAEILADKITKNSASEYLEIFSPRRFQTATEKMLRVIGNSSF
ncbi:MAG: glycine oxidase ThiO [Pyrinomonadaceae bacterium]